MRLRGLESGVPSWLWLWLPLGVLVLALMVKALGNEAMYRSLLGEWGFVETTTLVVLVVAVVYGIRIALPPADPAPAWIRWWVLVIALGSIYFMGEEASWGQHLFGWNPPNGWDAVNQQNETNLHNITGFGFLFDQLPRNLLTAAALLGGILVPLYRRVRALDRTPDPFHYWLWPTLACTPAALMSVLISVPQKLYRAAGAPLPDFLVGLNPGELKECFLAFFIMLYLASLAARIDQARKRRSGSDVANT